jgi:tRNA(Ile)-lysidine synthase
VVSQSSLRLCANPCDAGVARLLDAFDRPGVAQVGVAYSGGADSTALLLSAAKRWPGRIQALHVNHGMQDAAVDFERHCIQFCGQWGIAIRVAQLRVRPEAGESPEDAARSARYRALAILSSELAIENVLLAQHADDQVETVILALSRGAGLPGLSGMADSFTRHGVRFHRPVLDQSALALRHWLTVAGIPFIEDPSNANTALTRNRIRHVLMPTLVQAFPACRETFARSARHAAQAQELLRDLAVIDAAVTGLPPLIAVLQTLSEARQANVLRYWLHSVHAVAPSAAQLAELLKQLAACQTRGHHLRLKVATGYVVRNAKELQYLPEVSSN